MPRYYFFCEHEAGVIPDPEGMDLEDEPAALAQAMMAAGGIMRSNFQAGREALVGAVLLVKDTAGATLFRMPFVDPGHSCAPAWAKEITSAEKTSKIRSMTRA